MVQRGDPTQGHPERSLEDRDDALRGGMNRLPTLRTRGTAAFEQAFARSMLRLRKTVELNATSCSNAPAGPSLSVRGVAGANQRVRRCADT